MKIFMNLCLKMKFLLNIFNKKANQHPLYKPNKYLEFYTTGNYTYRGFHCLFQIRVNNHQTYEFPHRLHTTEKFKHWS